MDSDALKPILAGIVRHFLTSAGGALVAGGYIQSSDTSAFIGGGMVIAGVVWSWWQKDGQAEVAALLKKLTASKTVPAAVETAKEITAKASITPTVVKMLLVAFVLSAFLAGAPAFAQAPKLTGNIAKDIATATGSAKQEAPVSTTGGLDTALSAFNSKVQTITKELVDKAIADVTATHPTRRTNSERMARRREFNEAMRRRIRDIAASRDLSEEEIKPALTLKHEEIGSFLERHGVNPEWLLDGRGRIFERDPIVLSPNSTGSEFAAVVSTMPLADQQMIRTMVREILEERGA
ncbi:hypothetical protein [Bradyrhizobium sp. McL0616]|uniref:Pam3-gp28 family putative phage holin n=1 Tax=Bradyrhizobium sp. McL0616 TaxID=3415674 RepID=UPI003CFBB48A